MTSGTFLIGDRELPYTLQRSSKRRRTIAFSVKPETGLFIIAPMKTKTSMIEEMVNRRAGWIVKRIEDIKKHAPHAKPHDFISGETVLFLGEAYRLEVARDDQAPMGCVLGEGMLTVNILGDWLSEDTLRQEVRFEVMSWYKKQAKQKLLARTAFWQEATDIRCRRVMLSSPDRRWGSCSFENDIRLNWRIIMADPDLIDYLIVHELCHVVHKNHSARFWKLVGSILPDYAERRRQLRRSEAGYRID